MEITRTVDKHGSIYYKNEKGQLHREDGPAIVFFDGTEWYYLNNKWRSKEDWEQEVTKIRLKRILDL